MPFFSGGIALSLKGTRETEKTQNLQEFLVTLICSLLGGYSCPVFEDLLEGNI